MNIVGGHEVQPQVREVCYLVGKDRKVLWKDTSEDPGHLDDSRARWEAIWSFRDQLAVIAHSHPYGPEGFSREDFSTEAAIRSALGELWGQISFGLVTPTKTIIRDGWANNVTQLWLDPWLEPDWVLQLRRDSGMVDPVKSAEKEE